MFDMILSVMKAHIDDVEVCKQGCSILWSMPEGSCAIQKEACEKGGLAILLEVLRKHNSNSNATVDLLEACCGAIGIVLSSHEVYSKYCTQDVLGTVRECYERHKESEQIKQFLLGLTREGDARVQEAVAGGVCTKEGFPKCRYGCECDENIYCPQCCAQQKVFRCYSCDKNEVRLYCETCWKKEHQMHDCEEFFYPVRCKTK